MKFNVTETYRKISHAERINLIYRHLVLKITMRKLQKDCQLNYNSIRNIIDTYRKTGRTNKKNYKTVLL